MRVISGTKKGITLKAVPGQSTRPTTDKVKEAIFNIIGPYFNGGIGLDLYGGSGGLSIEALSRGLEKMIIVDQDKKAIATIKANLERCQLLEQTETYRNDAGRALKALIKRELRFQLIFLDPPYAKEKIASEIAIISDFRLLADDGLIVVEHGKDHPLQERIGNLSVLRQETYGDTRITIYHFENK
ncbi:rRNA methyltransferase [Alkalihalobacillus alcalophilus ATCC 27647 = CGMCC 1.3604]|uniref:DNA methyltransferase n=1 Tax=Alkalihalobacillus alcalophilus ATCC 27647 = CGMCC 1.3604 TaxID=1218173 RepID=A0A094YU68_ALKAL|nr:16S rRNA (guanine(966)-N(2))-methyltransferase RsmD [Alkalihalobacillus alcalophilus]KGA97037.1 DNA methyltransferase [Alkalihalobacillus alcalophilus ATCC 27647 = CGMCC 1.3604]MED1563406.1 16S rRNA (guanine(966)-N(2))-methyltransferase RsmD [Alkalihalobacillus alcalophilus]THG90048.1 rRNA methyltransferase [Alkalihalobacillus alcalophilus ATCC 27647 = CGMCC 1.3604]